MLGDAGLSPFVACPGGRLNLYVVLLDPVVLRHKRFRDAPTIMEQGARSRTCDWTSCFLLSAPFRLAEGIGQRILTPRERRPRRLEQPRSDARW